MAMTRITLKRAGVVLLTALLAFVCAAPVAAQQTTGNVRGVWERMKAWFQGNF